MVVREVLVHSKGFGMLMVVGELVVLREVARKLLAVVVVKISVMSHFLMMLMMKVVVVDFLWEVMGVVRIGVYDWGHGRLGRSALATSEVYYLVVMNVFGRNEEGCGWWCRWRWRCLCVLGFTFDLVAIIFILVSV